MTATTMEGEREGQAEVQRIEQYGDGEHNIKTDGE